MIKIKSTFIYLTSALFLVFIACMIFFSMKNSVEINCQSSVSVHVNSDINNIHIKGKIKFSYHLVSGGESHVSQYGVIESNGVHYIIDRIGKVHFTKQGYNDYYELVREGYEKNLQDNTPDQIYDLLISKQKKFQYKMQKYDKDYWQISDIRRTLLLCKKT